MGNILLIALMVMTALVLVVGIGVMIKGGEFNQKYGNKMMVLRVSFQGATLLLLGVLFLLSDASK